MEDGDAQWEHQYGQLKEMLAFWKRLPFSKLSTASPDTEGFMQVFYWKHSCCLLLNSYIFMTFLKWFRVKPIKGEGQKSAMPGMQSRSWSGRELSEQQSIPESKHLLYPMRLTVLFLQLYLPYHLHWPCEFILYVKNPPYTDFYGGK